MLTKLKKEIEIDKEYKKRWTYEMLKLAKS